MDTYIAIDVCIYSARNPGQTQPAFCVALRGSRRTGPPASAGSTRRYMYTYIYIYIHIDR